ncbi:TPM domain-containing protein [bacterium]|nr:TPM domain-containing protein [bacterium]MBU1024970.1 TPM domain-containing protein [bacterium]
MKISIPTFIFALAFFSILSPPGLTQTGEKPELVEYIEFGKRFDDRAGVLNDEEMRQIVRVAAKQEEEIGLKAFLLIMPSIPEWDFHEFASDQFDHWKMQGHVDQKSYLILITVDEKKFQIERGSYIDVREHDYELIRLTNKFYSQLKNDGYGTAIVSLIIDFGELTTLKNNIIGEKKQKEKAGYYMLIGILLLIFAFMRMGFLRKQMERKRAEMKEREGPFIE